MVRVNSRTAAALAAMLLLVSLPIAGTTFVQAEPAAEDLPSLDEIITTLEKQREQVKSLCIEMKHYWTPQRLCRQRLSNGAILRRRRAPVRQVR